MKKIQLRKEMANAAEGLALALKTNISQALYRSYVLDEMSRKSESFKISRLLILVQNKLRLLQVDLHGLQFADGALIEIPVPALPTPLDFEQLNKEALDSDQQWCNQYNREFYQAFAILPNLLKTFIESIPDGSELQPADEMTLDFRQYLVDVWLVLQTFVSGLPNLMQFAWRLRILPVPVGDIGIPSIMIPELNIALNKPEEVEPTSVKKVAEGLNVDFIIEESEKADFQGYITGVVLEPSTKETSDLQDQWIKEEVIEAACFQYMEQYQVLGLQHKYFNKTQGVKNPDFRLIYNWILHEDTTLHGVKLKKGTWIQTWKVINPTLKQKVAKGELTGFSIGGLGWISAEK